MTTYVQNSNEWHIQWLNCSLPGVWNGTLIGRVRLYPEIFFILICDILHFVDESAAVEYPPLCTNVEKYQC